MMEEPIANCLVCATEPFKYRCPKCEAKLCGLACAKRHKTEWDCDGQRLKTQFIPMSQFDSLTLLNDVRLLESATQVKGNCQRDSLLQWGRDDAQRAKEIRFLSSECNRRRIRLEFLPIGLQKHQTNTSAYNPIAQTIFWCVQWIFSDANNFSYIQERLPESVTVGTMVNRLLHPRKNSEVSPEMTDRLKVYQSSEVFCFMKVERNEWSKGSRFYQIDLAKTLNDNLQFRTVYEYPTIHVCLQTSVTKFPVLSDSVKEDRLRQLVWDKEGQSQLWSLTQLLEHMDKIQQIVREPKLDRVGNQSEKAAVESEEWRKLEREGKRLKMLAKQSAKVAQQSVRDLKRTQRRQSCRQNQYPNVNSGCATNFVTIGIAPVPEAVPFACVTQPSKASLCAYSDTDDE